MLSLVLLTGFAACSQAEPSSLDSAASSSQAENQQEIEEIKAFISEHVPAEYADDENYQCDVQGIGDGVYMVELTLNMVFDEPVENEELFDTIGFESYTLTNEVFADPPYPLNFVFYYLNNGEELSVVSKPYDSQTYQRAVDGAVDEFEFNLP